MDGVLFDSETIAKKTMREAFHLHNLEVDDEFYASLIGITTNVCRQMVAERVGSVELMETIYDEWDEFVKEEYENKNMPFKKGAPEIITWLKEINFPIAMATSNDPENIYRHFNANDWEVPFDKIVNGGMITHSKPHPEVFLKAAELLNTDIKECLIVEDSYYGVQAAAAAGGICVMVPDLVQPNDEIKSLTTFIKKDLFEVMDLIKQYANL